MQPETIRQRTREAARQLGHPDPVSVPLLESTLQPRPQTEVVQRVLALHCVIAVAYGFPREKAWTWLRQEGLADALTPKETVFLNTPDADGETFQLQVEAAWTWLWALSFVDTLDFGQPADDEFVPLFPNLLEMASSTNFREQAQLRSPEELLGAWDLATCLYAGLREAALQRKPIPGGLPAYITVTRGRALKWLFHPEGWDDVSLNPAAK